MQGILERTRGAIAGRQIDAIESVDLASSPEEVWAFIADTDRTNRIVAGGPVHYEANAADSPAARTLGARFVAKTRAGGFALTYDELPFEWSHGKHFRVLRKMRGGLMESYTLSWSLEPSKKLEGGTRATVHLSLLPRYGVLGPIAFVQAHRIVRRLGAFAADIDAHVRDHAPSPFREPVSSANAYLIDQGVRSMKQAGVREPLATRLAVHLAKAPDADLVRIRPFELADEWAEDRLELLRALLHAVQAGLFDLRWAIVCPSCRTASEVVEGLDAISKEGHCQLCDISFELELDRAVEATFVPHKAVRDIPNQMFCIGGPARTPHVLGQINIEASGQGSLDAPTERARYRLFARGGAMASLEVCDDGARSAALTLDDTGFRPADVRVAPGATLAIRNATAEARHAKVERLGYASAAATAHYLSTVSEFRRLFSSDLLKRGTPLKISRVSILFSDLTGSTALYTNVGDAAAFRLVDDHFDVVRAALEKHRGTIVKTMGDAVMAAFHDPRDAVRAGLDVIAAFEAFRLGREHGDRVGIKLGVFDGPCYVVTANGALDYFGQTVNVASRVQHLAESGQLVVSAETWRAIDADAPHADAECIARFDAKVKGVDAPLDLVRIALRAPPSAGSAGRT